MQAVKIINIPAGEAPPHIREAWVGLVLPLAEPELRRIRSAGVLNGPGLYFKYIYKFLTGQYTNYEGYVVEGTTAIAILARHNPAAAKWWRENSPYFLNLVSLFSLKQRIVRRQRLLSGLHRLTRVRCNHAPHLPVRIQD